MQTKRKANRRRSRFLSCRGRLVPYSRVSAKKNKKSHAAILGGSGEEVRGRRSELSKECLRLRADI